MPLQKQKQTVIVNIGDVAIKKKRKPRTTKPKPKPKKPKKPPASAVRRIATAEGARQEQFIYPIQPRYNEVAPTLAATRQPMPTPPPTLAPAPSLAPPPTQTEKAILLPASTINLAGERAIQRDNERILAVDEPKTPIIKRDRSSPQFYSRNNDLIEKLKAQRDEVETKATHERLQTSAQKMQKIRIATKKLKEESAPRETTMSNEERMLVDILSGETQVFQEGQKAAEELTEARVNARAATRTRPTSAALSAGYNVAGGGGALFEEETIGKPFYSGGGLGSTPSIPETETISTTSGISEGAPMGI